MADERKLAEWLGPVGAGEAMYHLADRIEAIERHLGIYPSVTPPDRTREVLDPRTREYERITERWGSDGP